MQVQMKSNKTYDGFIICFKTPIIINVSSLPALGPNLNEVSNFDYFPSEDNQQTCQCLDCPLETEREAQPLKAR